MFENIPNLKQVLIFINLIAAIVLVWSLLDFYPFQEEGLFNIFIAYLINVIAFNISVIILFRPLKFILIKLFKLKK